MPQAIVLIGPPGSGKDTQAAYLVEELGFVSVPSSKIIRAKFDAHPDDPVIREQKRIYDAGLLNDPVLVSEWILEFVRPLALQGQSVVFSGSPRTAHEADVEFPALQELYGVEYVRVVYLEISLEESTRRIAGRRFCVAQGHVFPGSPESEQLVACPQDGSALIRRELDAPELIATRHQQYLDRTFPVIEIARTLGVPVFSLEGGKEIEAVHHDIVGIIERRHVPVPAV